MLLSLEVTGSPSEGGHQNQATLLEEVHGQVRPEAGTPCPTRLLAHAVRDAGGAGQSQGHRGGQSISGMLGWVVAPHHLPQKRTLEC